MKKFSFAVLRKGNLGYFGRLLVTVLVVLSMISINVNAIAGQEPYYFESDKDNVAMVDSGVRVDVAASDIKALNNSASLVDKAQSEGYTKGDKVLKLTPYSEVEATVNVPKAGAYYIQLDYLVYEKMVKNLVLAVEVNGEFQFYDSRNIELYAAWKDSTFDYKKNEFGNDLYPEPERVFRWQTAILNSTIYNLPYGFKFDLKAGNNTIKLSTNDVPCLLGQLSVIGEQKVMTFSEYKASVKQPSDMKDVSPIVIEGEHFAEKSESYIRGDKADSQDFTPFDPSKKLINNLSGNMWKEPNNSVSYTFNIDTAGVYYINVKYLQKQKTNMHSFKQIKIDGEYLFEEMKEYPFQYTNAGVENEVLSVEGEKIPFYFEKGEHTLTMLSTASPVFSTYENLLNVTKTINDIALQIKVITGNKSDKNRDWNIDEYIPTLKDDLTNLSNTVMQEYNNLLSMSSKDNVALVTNLKIASSRLDNFKEDLNFLVNNLDQFSQGNNSVSEYVSLVLPILLEQPVDIDQITITPDTESIPKARKGFLSSAFSEVEKLALSFFIKPDNMQSIDKGEVNIWANRSVTHLDVLREMAYDYQEKNNVKINLSTMPEEQKLLLAVSSGKAPDAVIGGSNFRPFDFALRGAVYDLRQFSDFPDVIKSYHPQMFVPFIIEDSCFALPETANFQVLYYRKDIMKTLNLEVPKTWDDVLDILPTLSRYGMDFNTMIANVGGIKHFGATIPFIQQYNGKVYAEDGSKVMLGDPKTVEAFTLMTDLYTKYSLPESIPNFYNNFKKGMTPIGISDLMTYILLVNAAPEIAGQWAIAPSIGVRDELGDIKNFQPSVSSCNFILKDAANPQQAWDFIKWYMSDEIQSSYANQLQLRYGPQYIWNTANLNALANSTAFTPDDKKVIIDQLNSTMEIPRNPAYFAVERELSNAWNSVVFDGQPPRTALDTAITKSNREIVKKLKEFGYMDSNGNMIKPFPMADEQKVLSWQNEK